MKKTKDTEDNVILVFESKADALEFKKMATGRKFCKKGERLVDICDEEIERYNYENYMGFFAKLFKRKKFKQNKDVLMLEQRTTSIIRSLSAKFIRENEEISRDELINKVKEFILNQYNEYQKTLAA